MNFGQVEDAVFQAAGGSPQRWHGEPEFPGFFSNAFGNETQQYEQFQNMKAEAQKQSLLYQLDMLKNPMSLRDVSGVLGVEPEVLANDSQRRAKYGDYHPDWVDPSDLQPVRQKHMQWQAGEAIPRQLVMTPTDLLGQERKDYPEEVWDIARDQYEHKRAPFYKDGAPIPLLQGKVAPDIAQGLRPPVLTGMTRDYEGMEADPNAPASMLQRQLVGARVHQSSLRPNVGTGSLGATWDKFMLGKTYIPSMSEEDLARLVIGETDQERKGRQTTGNLEFMQKKGDAIAADMRDKQGTYALRREALATKNKLNAQKLKELEATEGDRAQVFKDKHNMSEAMQRYYDARLAGKDAELALKESKLLMAIGEAGRKLIDERIKFLHETKGELNNDTLEAIIEGVGKDLGLHGMDLKSTLSERLGRYLRGEEAPETSVEPVEEMVSPKGAAKPDYAPPMPQSGVPQKQTPVAPVKDANEVMRAMEKELGDLSKREGQTIKDKETGKQYKIQGGKLLDITGKGK